MSVALRINSKQSVFGSVIALTAACALSLGLFAAESASAAAVGAAAPDFTLVDTTGKSHTLSSYKGKTVVLEWFNKGCPYVKKHYEKSSNMQELQKKYAAKDVVWLTIVSSATGEQGHEAPAAAETTRKDWKIASAATLLDEPGTVGRMYDAKTTPQMYVIDKDGVLKYNGAIDSIPSTNAKDISKAEKYFANALDQVLAGQAVKTATTKPYGCNVKYK
ncbi:MAG: thioredoxin family protein [Bdellovibrionales bacterium]|nr:thioredoxin family protein [Bdellovibrionales bacterium]